MHDLKNFLRMRITQNYNGWIFYLQRVPGLKHLISDRWYHQQGLISFFMVISVILTWMKSILTRSLYFVLVWVNATIFGDKLVPLGMPQDIGFQFLFVLSLFSWVGAVLNAYFVDPTERQDVMMIKIFRMEPFSYYQINAFSEKVLWFLTEGVVLTGVMHGIQMGHFPGQLPILGGFYFLLFFWGLGTFLRYLLWPIHQRLITRDTDQAIKRISFIWALSLLISVLIHGLWLISPWIWAMGLFFQWPIAVLGILLFLIGMWRIRHYQRDINLAAKQTLSTAQLLAGEEDGNAVDTKDLEVNEDVDTLQSEKAFEQYHGTTYMNAIFFERVAKRKLTLPYRRLTLILSVAAVSILGLIVFFRAPIEAVLPPEEVEDLYQTVGSIIVLFAMYTIAMGMGSTLTRLCFFNMDRTMMKNHFYTAPKALRQTINYRSRKLMSYMLPILLVIVIFAGASYFLLGGRELLPIGLVILTAIVGMLFYSFHNLYLYYLIQPYTENMTIGSPIYKILSTLGYVLLIILSNNFESLTPMSWLIIFGVIFIYIVVGYGAVIKFAPSRFKLR
ncbi:MAG: hypothetical protein Q4A55_06885 [Aerococcus sp.]|nr:hypothetical protein [Aerococcus sp.]